MRICVATKTAKEGQTLDSKTKYDGDEATGLWVDMWQTALPNSSFFFTNQDRTVCEERLSNNASDFSSEAYPIEDSLDNPHFSVPVPLRSAPILMLTGYDMADIERKDVASAIHSVYLFETPVYMLMLAFLILFVLLVIGASLLRLQRELMNLDIIDSMASSIHRPRVGRMRRQVITKPGYSSKFVLRRVLLFFRDTSSAPRIISILVSLLSFGLITYFSSFFSTKSIVEEKPLILDTYEKLADHPNASVFFTGTQPHPSDSFKSAPASSVKGRIWARYKRTPAYGSESNSINLVELPEMYMKMRHHKYVMMSTYADLVACMICALRAPGELRHMHIMADPSEQQRIYGLALSTHLKNDRYILRKLTLFTESGLVLYFRQFGSEYIYDLAPRRENLTQQRVACLDGLNEEPSQQSPAPLLFWLSFFLVASILLSLALIILLLEILSFNSKISRTSRLVAPGR